MKLLVIEKHEGYGVFPLFPQGTTVSDYAACDEYPHWCSCVIGGYETFVAEVYVDDGVLIKDYNPTEIIVMKGQILTLIHIVFEGCMWKMRMAKLVGCQRVKLFLFNRTDSLKLGRFVFLVI